MDQVFRKTVLRQFLAALACLLVGAMVITAMTILAGSLVRNHVSQGDVFALSCLVNGPGLVAIVGLVTSFQHTTGASSRDTFKESIKLTVFVAAVALGLQAIFVVILGVAWQHFTLGLLSLVLACIQFALTGLTTGLIQKVSLEFAGFDPIQHQQLTSQQSEIDACRNHQLPFRLYVEAFWKTVFWGLVAIAGLAALAFWLSGAKKLTYSDGFGFIVGAVFCIAFVGIGLGKARTFARMLRRPAVMSVQGTVQKFKSKRSGRYTTWIVYNVRCCGTVIETPESTWNKIRENNTYQFWYYRPGGNELIAHQLIEWHQENARFVPSSPKASPKLTPSTANAATRSSDRPVQARYSTYDQSMAIPKVKASPKIRYRNPDLEDTKLYLGCAGRILLVMIGTAIFAFIAQNCVDVGMENCPGVTTAIVIAFFIGVIIWKSRESKDEF